MVWNDATYQDLLVSLYGMIQPEITKDIQAQIVNDMAARGHNITWDAIRLQLLFLPTMPKFEEMKVDLFEAIYTIATPSIQPEQKDEIVAFMNARGHETTWNAIRQHLQKLRKKEIAAPASGAEASSSATPKTPKKRAPAVKKTPGTKSAGKRKPKVESDDDEDVATPSKKAKAEPIDNDDESKPNIKQEVGYDGAYDGTDGDFVNYDAYEGAIPGAPFGFSN